MKALYRLNTIQSMNNCNLADQNHQESTYDSSRERVYIANISACKPCYLHLAGIFLSQWDLWKVYHQIIWYDVCMRYDAYKLKRYNQPYTILWCTLTDVPRLWMYCLSLLTSAYQGVPLPNWTWHASQLSNGWWHHILRGTFPVSEKQMATIFDDNSAQHNFLWLSFALKTFIRHLIITTLCFGQMPIGFYRRVALDFPAGLTFTTEFLGLTFIASSA